MVDSILNSLIDSGDLTEVQILVALQKSGFDVVGRISKAIGNVKLALENGSLKASDKLRRVDDAMRYLQVVREIIKVEADAELDDQDIDAPVVKLEQPTQAVRVQV